MISIIAAIAENGEIGAANDLLWRLPADMKRFKAQTIGHTVVMGRHTYESLPKGALPERRNVVITSNTKAQIDNCEIFNDLRSALEYLANEVATGEIFIIGGESIYRQAVAFADKMYITRVHHTFPEADVFFPDIDPQSWINTGNEAHEADDRNPFRYTFQIFIKKK